MSSIKLKLKSPPRPLEEDETGLPVPAPTASAECRPRPETKPKRSIRNRNAPVGGGRSVNPTHAPKAGTVARATEPSTVARAPTEPAVAPGSRIEALEKINRRALDRDVLTDPQLAARVRREAVSIRDAVFPAEFVEAAGLDRVVSIVGGRLHLLQFRVAAGDPADPVEQLLLEILAFARMRFARVHALAEQAKSPEMIRAYLNTGCRLMSEISKTVLTLSAYRSNRQGELGAGDRRNPAAELASKPEDRSGG